MRRERERNGWKGEKRVASYDEGGAES